MIFSWVSWLAVLLVTRTHDGDGDKRLIETCSLMQPWFIPLHMAGARQIWIDQSGFSRREKLYCPDIKDVRAQKVPTHRFFLNLPQRKVVINYCQKDKKNWGSPTSFWRELAPKNTLNLKYRASLADKATVSLSPKILQLDLWIEIFYAKYCLSGPIKWI